MHRNSLLIFKKHALRAVKKWSEVLEVSPACMPSLYYEEISGCDLYHTVGLDTKRNYTYWATDPYSYPIPDDSYDVVMSGQVVEHVAYPWVWMEELARIVKPHGVVITIGPVTWPYHEAPIDCWRIHPDGMRSLYSWAGLEMIHVSSESLDKHAPFVVDTIAIGEKA